MTEARADELRDLQQRLGVQFSQLENLEAALRHRSATVQSGLPSNERLEFLGDSVLGVCVCEQLYRQNPGMPEGEMAKAKSWLVSEPVLAQTALRLGIDKAIELSFSEQAVGGRQRPSILSDTFESIVGALFLDRGLRAVRSFVKTALAESFQQVSRNEHKTDYKSGLQEWTQSQYRCTPEYHIIAVEGRDHNRTFRAQVCILGRPWGTGSGRSKKSAEQAAARQALDRINNAEHPGEDEHTDEQ